MHILIPSINSGIYTPKLVRELIYKSGCAHDHSHDALHDYIINLHIFIMGGLTVCTCKCRHN